VLIVSCPLVDTGVRSWTSLGEGEDEYVPGFVAPACRGLAGTAQSVRRRFRVVYYSTSPAYRRLPSYVSTTGKLHPGLLSTPSLTAAIHLHEILASRRASACRVCQGRI
jgi:hypothetical protein